jgi:hypothetical protein
LLLASTALLVRAALGAPSAARAACVPSILTISGPIADPVVSNGRSILFTGGGSIVGGAEGPLKLIDVWSRPS